MKYLHVGFEDKEFKLIIKAKGDRTWYDVIMEWSKRELKEAEEDINRR